MGTRCKITDKTVQALKPAPEGKRVEVWDELVTGFGVRVTDKGAKSYLLYTRFDGKPSRRTIGDATKMSLADARKQAKAWLELAGEGRDPKIEAEQARLAKEGRITFGAALEEYIKRHVSRTRRAERTEKELRRNLLSKWAKRPLEDITKADVIKLIDGILQCGAHRQAHNVLALAKAFFNDAVEHDKLKFSPCAGIRARKLIGEKRVRTRVLNDAEIAAVWEVAEQTPYPYGPFVKLVLLTGARRSEASDASWSEFDLQQGLWTVPEERFKSGVTHRVPLSKDAVALLQSLPRWKDCELVFSFDGQRKMNCYSKSQQRFAAAVNTALGRECAWQLHDLRRTTRTRLASLGVPDSVAEVIIGHGKKGLDRVYVQHGYESEMREALERWAARLRSIVTPPPENVTDFEAKRRERA